MTRLRDQQVSLKSLPKKKRPKSKCCVAKSRCQRCPIRMLKEGTLPTGYTVRRRKLVRSDVAAKLGKKLRKAA